MLPGLRCLRILGSLFLFCNLLSAGCSAVIAYSGQDVSKLAAQEKGVTLKLRCQYDKDPINIYRERMRQFGITQDQVDKIEAEFDNIRAALAFSIADPDGVEPGLRLATGLKWFCYMRGHSGEIIEALSVLLARPAQQRCPASRTVRRTAS